MPRAVTILLIETSAGERRRLSDAFATGAGMAVVGTAWTASSAKALAHDLAPDAIVIGGAPGKDPLALVVSIMESAAAPIIVIGGPLMPRSETQRLLHAGAVAVVGVPEGTGVERSRAETELVKVVRGMSEVGVVTRRPPRAASAPVAFRSPGAGPIDVVAIGASTGGPQAIFTVLSGLPKAYPIPILIVQHMAVGFQPTLLDWLNRSGGPPVRAPAGGDQLIAGNAYLAPDSYHMGVDRGGRIQLSSSPPESSLKPAVSYLFRSVRKACGPRCIGVLLTGMGRDGADELKLMREAGGVTIAQDERSSVVYGMPREAALIGGATYVIGVDKVAAMLVSLTSSAAMAGR